MNKYALDFADIFECDELFHELGRIGDDRSDGHRCVVEAENAECAAAIICARLIPFFEKRVIDATGAYAD